MSRITRWLPVFAVVALLGAAMVAALYANPPTPPPARPLPAMEFPFGRPPGQSAGPNAEEPPPQERQESGSQLPSWFGYLITALCMGAILALLGVLIWSALRDKLLSRATVPEVADVEELRRRMQERVRAAVDEGLADLDAADGDPRRAVIACWVRLEAAAAAAGTPREPGDTSTELVARLLAEHAITEPVLAGFAAVYREARFAPHVVDEQMRDQARAALRQVRDELMTAPGASQRSSRSEERTLGAGTHGPAV